MWLVCKNSECEKGKFVEHIERQTLCEQKTYALLRMLKMCDCNNFKFVVISEPEYDLTPDIYLINENASTPVKNEPKSPEIPKLTELEKLNTE